MRRYVFASMFIPLLLCCRNECPDDWSTKVEVTILNDEFSDPGDDDLIVNGRLVSKGRIEWFTIGDVDVQATGDNYERWTVKLPNHVLREYRQGQQAILEVVAMDICGNLHNLDALTIPITAEVGTGASGLTVDAAPKDAAECYIPANGLATASVVVKADADAAGVPVKLSFPEGGELLGAVGDIVVLRKSDKGAEASVEFRSKDKVKGVGHVAIAASAGVNHFLDKTPIIVAAAPALSAAASVQKGTTHLVTVSTEGRLAACHAFAGVPDDTTVTCTTSTSGNLVEDVLEFHSSDCGQNEAFAVLFDGDIVDGAQVEIICVDTCGQVGSAKFTAAPPEPDG